MARSTALPAKVRRGNATPAFPALYRALRATLRPALARLFDLRVDGLEHLPPDGPYVIAANHHNYLDGVVLGVAVPQPIAFLVMPRVYRATPLHPFFHDHIRSIPIRLERPDVGALRRALGLLERGHVIGIFPEGPFSVQGRLERGLPGVALLALRSGVPVVPAGIRGTYEALAGRRFYIPRRHPVTVRFGPPRRFSGGDGNGILREAQGLVREANGLVREAPGLVREARATGREIHGGFLDAQGVGRDARNGRAGAATIRSAGGGVLDARALVHDAHGSGRDACDVVCDAYDALGNGRDRDAHGGRLERASVTQRIMDDIAALLT